MRCITCTAFALISCALSAWFGGTASAQATDDGVVSAPPEPHAEDAIEGTHPTGESTQLASETQRALLGEWMAYTGRAGRRARLSSGANQLIASSIGMGIGVALFVTSPATELSKGVGLALVGSSGVFMSLGIFQLAKKSQAELRLQRWNRVAKRPLSLRELGRFEGELRAQAETLDRAAKLGRWSSFGMAMTGALILGLTPAANLSRDASTGSYIAGGVMLGFGLLAFGLSFVGADENAYEAYSRGRRPLHSSGGTTVRAAPVVGRGLVGARVVGRF